MPSGVRKKKSRVLSTIFPWFLFNFTFKWIGCRTLFRAKSWWCSLYLSGNAQNILFRFKILAMCGFSTSATCSYNETISPLKNIKLESASKTKKVNVAQRATKTIGPSAALPATIFGTVFEDLSKMQKSRPSGVHSSTSTIFVTQSMK